MRFQTVFAALVIVSAILAPNGVRADMAVSVQDGMVLNWIYDDEVVDASSRLEPLGYYLDYNQDGLSDYLMAHYDEPEAHAIRLFAIDTSTTEPTKHFETHQTARRDILSSPGVFVPESLHMPRGVTTDSLDLIVMGTDTPVPGSGEFEHLILHRLDQYTSALTTQAVFEIPVDSLSQPTIVWSDYSLNADAYPDFLVYNTRPTSLGAFVITCYDGYWGTELWRQTMDQADEDAGVSYMDEASYLTCHFLPYLSGRGRGDFTNDGRPDLLLVYSYYDDTGAQGEYETKTNLSMISSLDGGFAPPYSSSWTLARVAPNTTERPRLETVADYDNDGFVDLLMTEPFVKSNTTPVFEGYSLRRASSLFASESGFSTPSDKETGKITVNQLSYSDYASTDVNHDHYSDLLVYRPTGSQGSVIKLGMFNGYSGGDSNAGRSIWPFQSIGSGSGAFDYSHPNVNDFNGDDLLDFTFTLNPEKPDSPNSGQVTWDIANVIVDALGARDDRNFTFVRPHSVAGWAEEDFFGAGFPVSHRQYDTDGDGQLDTAGSCYYVYSQFPFIDRYDVAEGYLFVYDNNKDATQPDITAEVQLKLTDEDWIPALTVGSSRRLGTLEVVDNNQDGFRNDIVVLSARAVMGISFDYPIDSIPTPTPLPGQVCEALPTPEPVRVSDYYTIKYKGDGFVDEDALLRGEINIVGAYEGGAGTLKIKKAAKDQTETPMLVQVFSDGSLKKVFTEAPIHWLSTDGELQSITGKYAHARKMEGDTIRKVSIVGQAEFYGGAFVSIDSYGESDKPLKAKILGATLTRLVAESQTVSVSVSSKKKKGRIHYGDVASRFSCENESAIMARELKKFKVTGGAIRPTRIVSGPTQAVKILGKGLTLNGLELPTHLSPTDIFTQSERLTLSIKGGNISATHIETEGRIDKLEARTAKFNGVFKHGYLGSLGYVEPGETGGLIHAAGLGGGIKVYTGRGGMDFDIRLIRGDAGIFGKFITGLEDDDLTPISPGLGRINKMQTLMGNRKLPPEARGYIIGAAYADESKKPVKLVGDTECRVTLPPRLVINEGP